MQPDISIAQRQKAFKISIFDYSKNKQNYFSLARVAHRAPINKAGIENIGSASHNQGAVQGNSIEKPMLWGGELSFRNRKYHILKRSQVKNTTGSYANSCCIFLVVISQLRL